MAQATNTVLQGGWGTIPGQVPVPSQNLDLARRYFVRQIPANLPSKRDPGLPTPNQASAVMGDCTFLLVLGGLCTRGIGVARINGQRPGFWLIDSTSGGHTNAMACSFHALIWCWQSLLLRLDPSPGVQWQTDSACPLSSQAVVGPFAFTHH